MRSTAFVVVCALGLIVAASVASPSPIYDIQLDWKNALLPCTCVNGTVDCSYRRKTSIETEDVCDVAPTALNLYNNLFVSFPDGFTSVVIVNASRNRLGTLPQASRLNPLLTVLDLSRNVISDATNELRELSSLQTLILRGNRLSHLRFLPEVCDLKRLDVSYNSLVGLEGPLSQCTQLKELNLINNELTSLTNGIFDRMSQLEVLRLDDNPIGNSLSSQIFDSLGNLKRLELYNNDFTSIPRGIFKSLSKLETLDIGLNDLSSLSGDIFSSLGNLKSLGMVRANMQTFPTGIFSPIPQLENLYLSVNFFSTLPSDAFIHLNNLKTLTLDFLNATTLPENFFTNLTELQVLSLYGNHLTSLPDDLLSGLNKLEKVDVSANRWTELPLQQLRNVKQLSLGYLGINSLEPRMFVSTPRVNMLFLYSNNISYVAENAFDGIALEVLSIDNNAIRELPQNVFQTQVHLKFIDLSRNFLVTLPEGIFSGMHNLLVLEVGSNKIQALPDQVFQPLTSLQVLDLSRNELTALSDDLFTNLRSLRKLVLDRNHLTVLPSVWHPHAAQRHVSLRSNAISQPDQGTLRLWLSGEGQLVLDLSDNAMRVGADALSPCDCGLVRRRRALLRLCVNASCPGTQQQQQSTGPGWVDAIRSARD
ncbi:Chaoptin [Gryllus bimaculatus]|nr:Chaoptin [Gryllus bimaculatus]